MIRAQGGGSGRASSRNTYNRPNAVAAKIQIRRNVLDAVKPAHVFDAFCGPTGEMWWDVWSQADSYVGCDTEFLLTDPRKRFVADNRRVLRSIDLQAFNVFDFDAFGSPWEQMLILAARRTWAPGERGAVVLTHGSGMRLGFGKMSFAFAKALGRESLTTSPFAGDAMILERDAIRIWCSRCSVGLLKMWQAESKRQPKMVYTAIVFEGHAARE